VLRLVKPVLARELITEVAVRDQCDVDPSKLGDGLCDHSGVVVELAKISGLSARTGAARGHRGELLGIAPDQM